MERGEDKHNMRWRLARQWRNCCSFKVPWTIVHRPSHSSVDPPSALHLAILALSLCQGKFQAELRLDAAHSSSPVSTVHVAFHATIALKRNCIVSHTWFNVSSRSIWHPLAPDSAEEPAVESSTLLRTVISFSKQFPGWILGWRVFW